MKVTNILLLGELENRMAISYDDGNSVVKDYPAVDRKDAKIVKEFGGHHAVTKATYNHNKQISKDVNTYLKFKESRIKATEIYAIDSLMAEILNKEEFMKLKLTIFDHEFVKNSKNREILTSIRKSEDPIDLIMYFGMLRKEANA